MIWASRTRGLKKWWALVSATTALAGCKADWRVPPCEGETEATCRQESVLVAGETREFLVSLRHPPACESGPVPLVLVWHGSGGNGASERAGWNDTFEDLALEETIAGEALVVYPDGRTHGDCLGVTCWDRAPDGPDLAFFDALIADLGAQYCVDTSRVFSIGHSRGGRFVEVLACYRGDAHRALASVAAGTHNIDACPGRAPIWLSHGVNDQTVSFSEGETNLAAWQQRNGCRPLEGAAALDRCTPLTGCDDGLDVVWCPTTEPEWNGHAVPGLADESIWSFFGAYL